MQKLMEEYFAIEAELRKISDSLEGVKDRKIPNTTQDRQRSLGKRQNELKEEILKEML